MHVTRDLSHKVCVIRELFVFGRENFVFLKFSQVIIFDILRSRSCDMTFEMLLPTSNPQFERAESSKFKKSNKWDTGHSSIKNSKACASCGEGAHQTED